jgi:Cytochrome c7 and related cytochrome c/Class III cytochrome C family
MAAIFTRRANLVMRVILVVAVVAVVVFYPLVWGIPQMDYQTLVNFAPIQPVPFSHKHHVGGLGIDCRYCHNSVEISSNAGIPPLETCMTCHSQLWTNAEMLASVRQQYAEHKPLLWKSVYTLPDFVYFDHSIHIAKGVGCTECHGPVGDMPLMRKSATLFMRWCLSCHRNPAPRLRPQQAVFDPFWQRTKDTPSGQALMALYEIAAAHRDLTDCSVCHR